MEALERPSSPSFSFPGKKSANSAHSRYTCRELYLDTVGVNNKNNFIILDHLTTANTSELINVASTQETGDESQIEILEVTELQNESSELVTNDSHMIFREGI